MARLNTRQQLIKMLGSLTLSDVREGEYGLINSLREKMFENEGPTGKKRVRRTKKEMSAVEADEVL